MTRSNEDLLKSSIASFLSNDLLGTSGGKLRALDGLSSADPMVAEYTARLLNAFASLYSGRSYLVQNSQAIDAMVKCLKSCEDQPATRDQLIGALQKLSLR